MSIIAPGQHNGGELKTAPRTVRQRVTNAIGIVLTIAIVALCFMEPALIFVFLGGGVAFRLISNAQAFRGHRAWSLLATAVAIAAIAAIFIVPENGDFVGALIVGVLACVRSSLAGVAKGWISIARIGALWEAVSWSEPILVGMLAGSLMAWLHRVRRLRISRRAKDSLVYAALSGDSTARAMVMLEALVVNLFVAYVVAGLLESIGGFNAGGAGALETAVQMHGLLVAGGGAGSGSFGTILQLIVALLALLGALIGFGMIIGLCLGAPAGAIMSALSWKRALHGAATAVTVGAFDRRPKLGSWIARAAIRGATEGLLTGATVSAALGILHVAGLS